jgi:hypothetical protein
MAKKKEKQKQKDLKKQMTAIVDIYASQKGKKRRAQLEVFIEQKVLEIHQFQEQLAKEKSSDVAIVEEETSFVETNFSPSPSVLQALNKGKMELPYTHE